MCNLAITRYWPICLKVEFSGWTILFMEFWPSVRVRKCFYDKLRKTLFYIFISSFQLTESLHSKNQNRQSIGNDNCSLLANSNLVSGVNENCDRQSYSHQQKEKITNISSLRPTASAGQKTYYACMSSIRKNFESREFSETSTNILMSSWKHSTKKQYDKFIKNGLSTVVRGKLINLKRL